MTNSSYSITGVHKASPRKRRFADASFPTSAEKICTIIILFYMSGAVVSLLLDNAEEVVGPIRPADFAIKAAIYALAFIFIVRSPRSFIRAVWTGRWILVPTLLTVVSVIWSQYPALTLRGSAVFTATTAVGVYFGARYTIPQQLRLLAYTLSLAIVGSYLFAIFLPGYGLEQFAYRGSWRGVFIEKNNLADIAVLAILVFYFNRTWMSQRLCWLGIATSLTALVFSSSATGGVVCCALFIMLPLYKLARAPFTLVIPVAIAVGLLLVGAVLVLMNDPQIVAQIVSRSPDLTGRTELWKALWPSINKRPWLGWGFSAFWVGMKGESSIVLEQAGWMAGYAHNGFLDILVEIGYVGLIAFLAGYVFLWRRALAYLLRCHGPIAVWFCTYLAMMILYNLTEGLLLEQNSLFWVIYIANSVSLLTLYARNQPIRDGRTL